MKNTPLDWIKEASEPARSYRKMVIGWQNSAIVLNSTVLLFNSEFLKKEEEREHDTHQLMREIAVKKLVISALFELKPQLDAWYRRLSDDGLLTEKTIEKKKEVRHLLDQVKKFEGIRNSAFHFGDVNEETEALLSIYDEIYGIDLALLNQILKEMMSLGYMLRDHASVKT